MGFFESHKSSSLCHISDVFQHISSLSAAWDGSSVWDLPIDSMAQAPTIEQMQQLEKSKSAKVDKFSAHFAVCCSCEVEACSILEQQHLISEFFKM